MPKRIHNVEVALAALREAGVDLSDFLCNTVGDRDANQSVAALLNEPGYSTMPISRFSNGTCGLTCEHTRACVQVQATTLKILCSSRCSRPIVDKSLLKTLLADINNERWRFCGKSSLTGRFPRWSMSSNCAKKLLAFAKRIPHRLRCVIVLSMPLQTSDRCFCVFPSSLLAND